MTEHTFESTPFEWKRVRIRRPPEGSGAAKPASRSFRRLSERSMRDRITITVAYRGGAEAWFEVSARGKRVFRPGGIALIDLMREICNERGAGSQVNT